MAIKASLTMNWSLNRDHACAPEKVRTRKEAVLRQKKSHCCCHMIEHDSLKKRKRNAEENPKLKLS